MATKGRDGDGYAPLMQTGTRKLEKGEILEGWIFDSQSIRMPDGTDARYLLILTEEEGIVKVSESSGLKGLARFAGSDVKLRIVCVGEVKTGAGSMKTYTIGYRKEAPALTRKELPEEF